VVEPFGVRLRDRVTARGPLCVGVDPHPALLRDWGLPDDPGGLERFARAAVAAVAGLVAVIKPQSAFFERYGSRGIAVLERVLADIRGSGALALLDVKRGDIGSTVAAYAAAYLDPASPLAADAITASPYLGLGALQPMFDLARATGAGVFVLARTSNPDGALVQGAVDADGRTVAQRILAGIAERNTAELAGGGQSGDRAGAAPAAGGTAVTAVVGGTARGLGSIGAVVGATRGSAAGPADLIGLRGPILAPGLGAQGATVADLPSVFGPALPVVLPAASREVLRHGPDAGALRAAVSRLAESLAALSVERAE
jgi:orotidine-5'-phosphate decarboxylase